MTCENEGMVVYTWTISNHFPSERCGSSSQPSTLNGLRPIRFQKFEKHRRTWLFTWEMIVLNRSFWGCNSTLPKTNIRPATLGLVQMSLLLGFGLLLGAMLVFRSVYLEDHPS